MDVQAAETMQTANEAASTRQNAVLESALALLVAGGERAITTAGVARAANCSKESLYKWFGDRDGLLAAMITYQASKVRVDPRPLGATGQSGFRAQLVGIAANLLAVLAGDVSLALNRLAIGAARPDAADLGHLVLEHGRRPIEARLSALLLAGREAGLIAFEDAHEAYATLYGLVVRDMHVRLLLGEEAPLPPPAHRAEEAVDQFLRLFGAEESRGPVQEEAASPSMRNARQG